MRNTALNILSKTWISFLIVAIAATTSSAQSTAIGGQTVPHQNAEYHFLAQYLSPEELAELRTRFTDAELVQLVRAEFEAPAAGTSSPQPFQAPVAGNVNTVEINDIIETGFPEVRLLVRPRDLSNVFVDGLAASDFQVRENGTFANVTDVKEISCSNDITRSVVMLIDTSGSMSGRGITEAQQGALQFINSLSPFTRVAMIEFNSDVKPLVNFTVDRQPLINAINGLSAQGLTSLYDAIVAGASVLSNEQTDQKIIALFSDGQDTASNGNLQISIDAADGASAAIYGVGAGSFSRQVFDDLTTSTGGMFYDAGNVANLSFFMNSLVQQFQRYYEVTYQSTLPIANDGLRISEVLVNGTRGIGNYIAEKPCTIFANDGGARVAPIEILPGNRVGQSFVNRNRRASQELLVELYLENTQPSELSVSLYEDDNGQIGSFIAESDFPLVEVACAGWYRFSFYRTLAGYRFLPAETYHAVIQATGPTKSYIRANAQGPFIRVHSCTGRVAPIPTPTQTVATPTPDPNSGIISQGPSQDWVYTLDKGWNSFSTNYAPDPSFDFNALTGVLALANAGVDLIGTIENGAWVIYDPLTGENNRVISPERGYYVFLNDDAKIKLTGPALTSTVPFQITPGWNTVSIAGPANTNYTARALLEDMNQAFGDRTVLAVAEYDQGVWQAFMSGFGGRNFPIREQKGYLIYALDSFTYQP